METNTSSIKRSGTPALTCKHAHHDKKQGSKRRLMISQICKTDILNDYRLPGSYTYLKKNGRGAPVATVRTKGSRRYLLSTPTLSLMRAFSPAGTLPETMLAATMPGRLTQLKSTLKSKATCSNTRQTRVFLRLPTTKPSGNKRESLHQLQGKQSIQLLEPGQLLPQWQRQTAQSKCSGCASEMTRGHTNV